MDNLCHTLVGAAMGEAGLKRSTPLGMATLVIGANLPDVDGFAYVFGDNVSALAFRRGWTHGVLAVAVLPLALAGATLAFDRLVRRRRRPGATPARFRPLLLLAFLSVLSHPLLDFLNTYGVRFLAPFSWRWFYGDALFIVDPWIWLGLAAGIGLSRLRQRRGLERPQFPAHVALAVAGAYVLAMIGSGQLGRRAVEREARRRGMAFERQMVGPVPLRPLRRQVLLDEGAGYRYGTLVFAPEPSVVLEDRPVASGAEDPGARLAASTREGRQFLSWARFPLFRIERSPGGDRVILTDARYPVSPGGWASAVIPLPPSTASTPR